MADVGGEIIVVWKRQTAATVYIYIYYTYICMCIIVYISIYMYAFNLMIHEMLIRLHPEVEVAQKGSCLFFTRNKGLYISTFYPKQCQCSIQNVVVLKKTVSTIGLVLRCIPAAIVGKPI